MATNQAPTLMRAGQRAPLSLRDKPPRAKTLAKLLRDGRVRRERRGTSPVLVA